MLNGNNAESRVETVNWTETFHAQEARACDSLGLKNCPKYRGVGVLFPDFLRSWYLVAAPHRIDNKCLFRCSARKKACIILFHYIGLWFSWNMKWGHRGRGGD